jgi:transcriptional regulator with XRE-family HTH domain
MSELVETLREELRDPEYRKGYDESFLNHLIATQIRVVREQRGLTQAELAKKTGMKQSRISAIEDEDYGSWSVNTLRRVAHELGVRLRVYLEEWGTLLDDVEHAGRKDLERRKFEDDPEFHDTAEPDAGVVDISAFMRRDTHISQQTDVDRYFDRKPPKNTLQESGGAAWKYWQSGRPGF